MDYLMQGGWVMLIIVICSIVALAIFFERIIYLRSVIKNANVIRKEMRDKFRGIKVGEALAICDSQPGTASNIIRAGLSMTARSREEMEKAMEDVAKYELPKLHKNLPVLATIVNVATLLGLLGTVLGMITSTSVLASQGLGNPQDLIGGIAQALVTTAAGLIVSIPSLIAYNYLIAKVDSIIVIIETSATELIKVLKPNTILGLSSSGNLKKW